MTYSTEPDPRAVASALHTIADAVTAGLLGPTPREVTLSRHRVTARELLAAADMSHSAIDIYDPHAENHHRAFAATTMPIFTRNGTGVDIAYKLFSNDVAPSDLTNYALHNQECLKGEGAASCAAPNGDEPSILNDLHRAGAHRGEAGSDVPARGEGL